LKKKACYIRRLTLGGKKNGKTSSEIHGWTDFGRDLEERNTSEKL
jgi:hypothetical protein